MSNSKRTWSDYILTLLLIYSEHRVAEAAMHRNIRNIGAPDLVGPFDGDAAQQIRVDLVTWSPAGGTAFFGFLKDV